MSRVKKTERTNTDHYKSFCRNLIRLQELKDRDPNDSYVISGAVWNFSMTFILACRTMEDIMTEHYDIPDSAIGSPRDTLYTAYSVHLIKDDIWMRMLSDRNYLMHTYDESRARKAVDQIRDQYIPEFTRFRNIVSEYAGHVNQDR